MLDCGLFVEIIVILAPVTTVVPEGGFIDSNHWNRGSLSGEGGGC